MGRRLLTLAVLALGLLLCGLGVALTSATSAPLSHRVEAGSDDGFDNAGPPTISGDVTGGVSDDVSRPVADRPTPTSIPTGTLSPTSTPTPTPHRGHLPLAQSGYVRGPDLVVEIVIAGGNSVWVIIKNQGDAPVTGEFWVDVYVNPTPAPTRVNQVWEQLGDQGLVWGITAGALPLEAGEKLALANVAGDPYYLPEESSFSTFEPDTTLYVQVDSVGESSDYGGVLENHEISGGEYNNVVGPFTVGPFWGARE